MAMLAAVDNQPSVGAVVVGHDTQFNFKSLCLASLFLERPVSYVATNPDAFDVVSSHRMPGNGCFVAAVSCAAGRPPDAICGKPATPSPTICRRVQPRSHAHLHGGRSAHADIALAARDRASPCLRSSCLLESRRRTISSARFKPPPQSNLLSHLARCRRTRSATWGSCTSCWPRMCRAPETPRRGSEGSTAYPRSWRACGVRLR